MKPTSKIEISRKALKNNLEFIQQHLGDGVVFSSVVKGNAYGHGIEEFVPVAEDCGVRHFSVFDADEAYRARKSIQRPDTHIMIMGMIDNDELEWAIEQGISFYAFELDRLYEAMKFARKLGQPARVHIEVETGMNRTGYDAYQLQEVAHLLKNHPETLRFEGLCTHFAGAESIANYVRVMQQRKAYYKAYNWFRNQGLIPAACHTACSAAAMRYPPTRMNMVRIGIMQYGFWPSRETFIEYSHQLEDKTNPLQRLISWKSRVMDTKRVKTGEYVGYGTSYLANEEMVIATIPIGYAHGFSRSLSNSGRVLIHGKRVAVIGMVNMNAIIVDISQLDGVEKGDEAVIIGYQGDMELSVSSFGEFSDQVNYELLTRLPQNIPREIVD